MNDLVTIETFIQQVWDIEGVKINITLKDGTPRHLVRPYNYDKLPDDATVDDLKARINNCINKPFNSPIYNGWKNGGKYENY